MKLFLTSSPGGSACVNGIWGPSPFDRSNGFLSRFRQACEQATACLLISSDPENTQMNDEMRSFYQEAFIRSHMRVQHVDVCDCRNAEVMMNNLHVYGVLILAGGHVPTEHAFFETLHLRERLRYYHGVILGISAGTMNCAGIVYAAPEEPGEAVDPNYKKYVRGLGLTDINVLPHFQQVWNHVLDGLRMVEDICIPDSKVRPIYALPDGTYFYRENGRTVLYGEAWLFKDGVCTKIGGRDQSVEVYDEP